MASELLYGVIGKTSISVKAFSGGGRTNKEAYPGSYQEYSADSYDPRRLTEKQFDVRGGPLPPGLWKVEVPYFHPNYNHEVCKLIPHRSVREKYPEREYGFPGGFYIHGAGPKGSDGCIVINLKNDRIKLMNAIKQLGKPIILKAFFPSVSPAEIRSAILRWNYT